MSRIGKRPIELPQGVAARLEGMSITVKGPKGELSRELPAGVKVSQAENVLVVSPETNEAGAVPPAGKERWGLVRTLIANMVEGVTQGFEKKLEMEGVGYRAALEGENLVLNVGYSHPVAIEPPEGVAFHVERNTITVSGINKEDVGQTAARVRKARPVEPYKGKGIRYQGEVVRRKEGKKATGTAG